MGEADELKPEDLITTKNVWKLNIPPGKQGRFLTKSVEHQYCEILLFNKNLNAIPSSSVLEEGEYLVFTSDLGGTGSMHRLDVN